MSDEMFWIVRWAVLRAPLPSRPSGDLKRSKTECPTKPDSAPWVGEGHILGCLPVSMAKARPVGRVLDS